MTTHLGIIVPELFYIEKFWQSFNAQLTTLNSVTYKIYTEVEKTPNARNDRGKWYNPVHVSRLAETRNRLINAAISEGADLIYMIDDDLYLAPNTLSRLIGYMLSQDTKVPLIVGAVSYSVEFNKLLVCEYNMFNHIKKLPHEDFYILPPNLWIDQNWLIRTADLLKYFPSKQYIPNHIWETLEFCRAINSLGWRQVLYTAQLALCDVEVLYD